MIPYVEILDKYTLKRFDLVEPQECWFELSYYEVGEFEVYCKATAKNIKALKKGHFVKIPNKRFVWIITSVHYTFTADGARMISAKGYEGKWLLKKRVIQMPVALQGTITSAVYKLVSACMADVETTPQARRIKGFTVDTNELGLISVSGTQAPRGNLLEFLNPFLQSYNCGSQVIYENGTLKYRIFNGEVKPHIRFSQSMDNLISSEYLTDDAEVGTHALVVSTFDETESKTTTTTDENGAEITETVEIKKVVDYTQIYDTGAEGIDRAEILVESKLSTKYEDASGAELETTPDSALYKGWQLEEGRKALETHAEKEEVSGEIDLQNSNYKFDTDFFIGDIVKVQDEYFYFAIHPRILKYTIKQDAKSYGEIADYGG